MKDCISMSLSFSKQQRALEKIGPSRYMKYFFIFLGTVYELKLMKEGDLKNNE